MLLGLDRVAMAGGGLPYDEELEYLVSNGYQYIDTGLTFNQNACIEIAFSPLVRETNMFCGARLAFQHDALYVCLFSLGDRTQIGYGGFNGQTYIDGLSINVEYTLTTNKGVFTVLNADGTTFSSVNAGAYTFETPCNFLLFTVNNNGTPRADMAKINLKYAKITDGNNSFNAIPVLKCGVPCLFDKISGGLFYNQVLDHQFGYCKKDGTIVAPT